MCILRPSPIANVGCSSCRDGIAAFHSLKTTIFDGNDLQCPVRTTFSSCYLATGTVITNTRIVGSSRADGRYDKRILLKKRVFCAERRPSREKILPTDRDSNSYRWSLGELVSTLPHTVNRRTKIFTDHPSRAL
eukprot:scaffold11639_cov172-Amphora_coffeaeformis.AAC.14